MRPRKGAGRRILVVDDEEMLRELLCQMLASPENHVESAGSFLDARRFLFLQQYDWVLLDRNLGDGDGMDLLRMIRQLAPQTRVVMVTSDGNERGFIAEALQNGAEAVIAKPFHASELMNRINGQKKERG